MKSARDSRNYRIITEKVSYLSCLRECSDQGGKPFGLFAINCFRDDAPSPGYVVASPAVDYQLMPTFARTGMPTFANASITVGTYVFTLLGSSIAKADVIDDSPQNPLNWRRVPPISKPRLVLANGGGRGLPLRAARSLRCYREARSLAACSAQLHHLLGHDPAFGRVSPVIFVWNSIQRNKSADGGEFPAQ